MPALDSKLRSQLDGVCQDAREIAEAAAVSALKKRAVDAPEPFPHFAAKDKKLRNQLRARGRQAGDVRQDNKTQGIEQLTQELAYEYWHRMLFARFLAENHLLMHPVDGVAVNLEECEGAAKSEGAANGFVLAARYASKMLPKVFRTDDVLLEVEFSPEHRLALEKQLAKLPCQTFLADDSLGWVYQFWQSKKKDEINKSGKKIDGRTLPAVTQLFTEDYMVQFLLHNTIGAWWCARHGVGQAFQPEKRDVRLESLTYLRWRDDGTPAAGTFAGWPKTFKEFKLLDPCCGSGHFLVAAFNLLVPLRMHDERLPAREACDAVLRENLFGLELDPRCTQIAAFALAVAAWKYPDEEGQPLGYRELPPLNIACTGIGPQATEDEWLRLAEQSGKPMTALSREPILNGLRNLHALFSNAPTLGSLIDPNQLSADLISADYETLHPYLAAALKAETSDDDAHERAVAAAGMVKATELLAGEYTLVITNVPFLGYREMDDLLLKHVATLFPDERGDLGYCLWRRFHSFIAQGGTTALVTLQHWLSLRSYTRMRENLLTTFGIGAIAHLGTGAFETISGAKVNVTLTVATRSSAPMASDISLLDAANWTNPTEKAMRLKNGALTVTSQKKQYANPDHRISFGNLTELPCLSEYADCLAGIMNGDSPKFIRNFWELPGKTELWAFLQSTVSIGTPIGGLESVIFFDETDGHLREEASIRRIKLHNADERGNSVWGRPGVAISEMSSLSASRYFGNKYDSNVAAIVPKRSEHLAAIWAFCSSDAWHESVRAIDRKLNVTNATFGKVPFDLAHWQAVAAEKYPNGLPEPESDDPTQWLFHGRPEESTAPLQVAVARLLGYRWPAELDENMRLSTRARALVQRCDELLKFADSGGIVCVPAVRTEPSAAERLSEILRAVGQAFQPDIGRQAGKPDLLLDDWLRNAFFEQHCKLFQNRPFIWHLWDGRKDGFAALVNYHKLEYKSLENLAYAYLGDWITAQRKSDNVGADLRLAAAQALQEKLKLILAGEPPCDIFVRWKRLHEQAIGWRPDLNDGVRMNIRPFVEAGILRKTPNIKWTKDRGKEPERDKDDYPWFWKGKEFAGDRVNDVHSSFPLPVRTIRRVRHRSALR